jgi:hypothetical protein
VSEAVASTAEGRRKPTQIETMVLRAFGRAREKPVILFAIEGLGMGWGLIDFRYRDLRVRLDAEKGCAVAFLALSDEFTPCWYLHDALKVATGIDQGYLGEQELCARLARNYEPVMRAVASKPGQAKLAAMQSPQFAEWAAESAKWRSPAEQARFATMIAETRQRERAYWRPKHRDWALIAILLTAVIGLSVYSKFFWQR